MKRGLVLQSGLFLFLPLLTGAEFGSPNLLSQTSTTRKEEVQVAEVLDGDSIEAFRSKGARERIRYTAIDAPELSKPFGEEARRRNAELVADKKVWLEWEERDGNAVRDRNGRLLAYVYLEKETRPPVAVDVVRSGHARIDIRGVTDSTPDDDFRLKWLKELSGAQIEAVKARRGWWGKEDLYRASDLAIAFIKFWGRDEVVYIVNRGKEQVNLQGLTLEDAKGKNKVSFRQLMAPGTAPLLPGGLLRIHSGPAISPRSRGLGRERGFWVERE